MGTEKTAGSQRGGMPMKWHSTKYKGVRYREHESRKHGVKKDRYYVIRYQRDGQRKEEAIGWTSERDPEDGQYWTEEKAALVLARLKVAAKHGTKEAPTRLAEKREIEKQRKAVEEEERERQAQESITFGEFFTDTYLPQCKVDKKLQTSRREEGFFHNWFKPILGNLPLKSISAFPLEQLKKELADKGQSNRSIEYALAVVRQVFNMAKHRGIYEGESPTAKVKKPKVDNGRMRFLTQEEADMLLEALKIRSIDVHDITLLSLHAWLRFREISALTWQDVDLERGTLTIREAKAGSHYAFLTNQAAEMLRSRTRGKPSEHVFQKRGGGKLCKMSHTFFRVVNDLCFNKGIDDHRLRICAHSCRHTYASWMIEEGQDLYTVQRLLGHKTNKMTQRYAHLSENKLKDAAAALGSLLSKNEAKQDQTGQVMTFLK